MTTTGGVEGTERTRLEVQQTAFEARKAMGPTGVYSRIRRTAERATRRRLDAAT